MASKRHSLKIRIGITLLESLLASAVLALAATAVIMPFAAGAQNTAQDARTTLAVNLAQDLMEEVLSHPYADPNGTEAGESGRGNWDDIQDYSNFTESEGNIHAYNGALISDPYATYLSRHVDVQSVYVTGQDQGKPATFLRVTVHVYYHGNELVKLSRLVYSNQ